MEKTFLYLRILVLFIFTAGTAFASPGVARGRFDEIIARTRFYRLENGLRVLMYRRDIAPVFAGTVITRVGGTDEPSGMTGISHMLEHMAFKGTPEIGTTDYSRERELLAQLEELAKKQKEYGNLDEVGQLKWESLNTELKSLWVPEAFSREYEKLGASGLNATTDTELTRYFVNLPSTAFEAWCYLESERILRPVMRQFYKERDVVMEERRMRYEDNPSGKMYELMLGSVFRVHPYRNPVIGYPFDLRRLTATMVTDFHRKYYVPSNMVVAVVGDINPEADLPVLEKYFGRIPAGEEPIRPWSVEPKQLGERKIVLEERASPDITVVYHKPQYPHPDDAPISVTLEILAGSRISPMYVALVKKQRLAAGVSQSEGPGAAYPNLMMFDITPRSPHGNEEVLKSFDQVLNRFKNTGATVEQLETAKRSIAMDYLQGLRANMALALSLASSEIMYNDWKAAFDWYDKAMAVTLDDIRRVTAQYFNNSNRTVVFMERKEVKKEPASSLMQGGRVQ